MVVTGSQVRETELLSYTHTESTTLTLGHFILGWNHKEGLQWL